MGPDSNAPKHSWFCAPEMLCPLQGVTPVMGVRGPTPPVRGRWPEGPEGVGNAVIGERSSPLRRPPAILKVNCPEGAREGGLGHWFLSHRWERNSPRRAKPSAARRRRNSLCEERNRSIIAPSSVTASPCHLPPRGKAFEGERPSSAQREGLTEKIPPPGDNSRDKIVL